MNYDPIFDPAEDLDWEEKLKEYDEPDWDSIAKEQRIEDEDDKI